MEIKTQETLFKYLKENLKENSDPNIFFKSLTNKIFNVNIELVFSPLKQVDSLYFILIAIINLEADKRQKIVKKYDGNDLLNILMIDLLSPELEYDLKLLAMSLISLKIVYVLYFSNIPEITFPGKTDFTLGNFSKLTDLLKIKLNEPSKKFADLLISKGFIPEKTLKHLNSCLNLDGGYGSNPGRESHCGYIYAALCSYKLLIQFIDSKTIQESINLPRLLSFYKLLDAGPGIRGRINKEPDLCYNFWVFRHYKY
ncbi:Geranylgeranyl transferase type-2 subunit beta [Cucumispora dikerogammari]|nr:Geranylgeranyl transferase type-2 subunit beta [Cucumispora dikerogammari]